MKKVERNKDQSLGKIDYSKYLVMKIIIINMMNMT